MSNLLIFVFLSLFSIVLVSVGLGAYFMEQRHRRRVGGMLRAVEGQTSLPQATVLIQRAGAQAGGLARLLSGFDFLKRMETSIQQAGLEWTVTTLLLSMACLALLGAVAGLRFNFLLYQGLSVLAGAVLFGLLPWLYVLRAGRKRLARFEEQFPEALDFLARALRAGHAFTVSLEMLGAESPEPLRSEFRKIYNEQNLGEELGVVLRHLAERVPLVDVRFFVSAILIQRESGGNLAEILTKLSSVIRERFRLKGQVKAVSAHGRITATVLTVLPIITVALLSIIAPGYLSSMTKDPDGKYLILFAIFGQVVGYFVMRKIIRIRV